jgi:hypothetical protein
MGIYIVKKDRNNKRINFNDKDSIVRYEICSTSVIRADAVEVKGIVRAHLYLGGWIL